MRRSWGSRRKGNGCVEWGAVEAEGVVVGVATAASGEQESEKGGDNENQSQRECSRRGHDDMVAWVLGICRYKTITKKVLHGLGMRLFILRVLLR